MANTQNVSFVSPGFDYSSDISEIERRRKLAEALQSQADLPFQQQQAPGGYVVPFSPWQGFAKVATQYNANKQAATAERKQRELSARAQRELTGVLTQAQEAAVGRPARTIQPDPQEVEQAADQGTPAVAPVNQPAIPADAMKAATLYMSHPMTTALGQQMMGQELSRQRLIQALKGGEGAHPMAPGPGASVMAGSGTEPVKAPPRSAMGGPAGGVPMEAWLAADPTGKTYMEQLAKDKAPINVRPGGTVYVPGEGAQYYAPKLDEGMTMGPGGAAVQPGYMDARTNLSSLNTTMVKVPVSNQRTLDLTQPEAIRFNQSGGKVLPTRYQALSRELPGATFADGPQGQAPQAAPGAPGVPAAPSPAPVGAGAAIAAPGGPTATRAPQVPQVPVAPGPKPEVGVVGATQSQGEQIEQARQTAAGKAVDEQFAKDYVSFKTGGAQDAQKQLAQLGDVKTALETPGADLTGFLRGKVPDFIQGATSSGQKAIAMRERVEEVVQRSLRVILGAQFTEKEGERLIARAYNPSLGEHENAIRVGRLLTQLQQAYNVKANAAQYFEKNGTLAGWQGKLPTASDFDPTPPAQGAAPSQEQISDLLKRYGRH